MPSAGTCANCAALQAKLDDVKWLIDVLDEVDDFQIGVPAKLNQTEKRALRAIMRASSGGRAATHSFIETCLDVETKNPRQTVQNYVSRLRRKLGPHGIEIEGVWDVGYRLDQSALQRLSGSADQQQTR
jgi:DNA-binding response OmpR family regulator